MSESGDPASCIIDCEGTGTCFDVGGWYDYGLLHLRGVTVRNAETAVHVAFYASGFVTDCIVEGCTGTAFTVSGSPSTAYGQLTIEGCTIRSNTGHPIFVGFRCRAEARNCVFYDNGGLLYLDEEASGTLRDCTIAVSYTHLTLPTILLV